MSVSEYCALNLERDGKILQDLDMSVSIEQKQELIYLTDPLGDRPANLTPEMANWYDSFVRHARSGALDEVEKKLTIVDGRSHGGGIFLERELWKAHQFELKAKRDAESDEVDRRRKDYEDLAAHRAEVAKLSARYEEKRNRYNREPVMLRPWIYIPLLMVLGITDMALNWEHIFEADIGSPIIALGISFGIAVGLACSGHLTGATMRQAKARFSRANDDLEIWAAWKMFSLAGLLLSISLAVVYWIRFEYFGLQRVEAMLLGTELPNLYGTVVGSLLTNIVVWIVGTTIAFLKHDPDPGFPEAKASLVEEEAKLDRVQRSLNKHLNRRFEQISAQVKEKIEGSRSGEKSLANVPEQQEARRMIEKIKAQDARVLAALSRYRSALTNGMRGNEHMFVQTGTLQSENQRRITPAEYSSIGLEMGYA
jgi:hypothetical protein